MLVLKIFGCSWHPIVAALTVGLGVKSTKSVMTMYKTAIKYIKELLGDLVDPNNAAADRVNFGIQSI